MTSTLFGFVGLGHMGRPMAANMAKHGFSLIVYDKAGASQRAPEGTMIANSLAEVARAAETIFLSVPDGRASFDIAKDLDEVAERVTKTIIDLSTTGVESSEKIHAHLAAAHIRYVDSPVSGGQTGARAGTVTLIWSGSSEMLKEHRAILETISKNIFHVGDHAGQGQAMKLLNNFLSATALAATSEAVVFGLSQGLDMKTILDVVNVSTGCNTASSDKFPNRILTGTYDTGFHTALMAKDVQLYMKSVIEAGTPGDVGTVIDSLWRQVDAALPGSDQAEIYQFLLDAQKRHEE